MTTPRTATEPRRSRHSVLGVDIPKVRPTAAGVFWLLVYLGLPVAVIGNLMDLLAQILLGWCIGFWCLVQ